MQASLARERAEAERAKDALNEVQRKAVESEEVRVGRSGVEAGEDWGEWAGEV